MKNLENLGVQELSTVEQREMGGGWVWVVIGAAFLIGLVAGLWDKDDSCPETDC